MQVHIAFPVDQKSHAKAHKNKIKLNTFAFSNVHFQRKNLETSVRFVIAVQVSGRWAYKDDVRRWTDSMNLSFLANSFTDLNKK